MAFSGSHGAAGDVRAPTLRLSLTTTLVNHEVSIDNSHGHVQLAWLDALSGADRLAAAMKQALQIHLELSSEAERFATNAETAVETCASSNHQHMHNAH
jgi:hypothetical protein